MLCLTLACTGCMGPIKTDSQISLERSGDGPSDRRNSGQEQLRPAGADARRGRATIATIAVVDVDGLLVNQNVTGPYCQRRKPGRSVPRKAGCGRRR